MEKVVISKNEYQQLKRDALAYRRFSAQFFASVIKNPIDAVVNDFKKTNLYSPAFLDDLQSGLSKSSYAKKYAHKTTS